MDERIFPWPTISSNPMPTTPTQDPKDQVSRGKTVARAFQISLVWIFTIAVSAPGEPYAAELEALRSEIAAKPPVLDEAVINSLVEAKDPQARVAAVRKLTANEPALRAVAPNPDTMACATLREFFETRAIGEDIVALAPDILAALKTPSPADTMFSNEIRMSTFKALTRLRFQEGIEAGIDFAFTQSGHGSEVRTGEVMKEIIPYGSAAQPFIPRMRELSVRFNKEVEDVAFPSGGLNQQRVGAVEDAIRAIQSATDAPKMRTLSDNATARATIESVQAIGTMGKGERVLQGDEEAVLFEHQGKGCLSHFWFGGNFEGVEDTRIR